MRDLRSLVLLLTLLLVLPRVGPLPHTFVIPTTVVGWLRIWLPRCGLPVVTGVWLTCHVTFVGLRMPVTVPVYVLLDVGRVTPDTLCPIYHILDMRLLLVGCRLLRLVDLLLRLHAVHVPHIYLRTLPATDMLWNYVVAWPSLPHRLPTLPV